MQASVITSINPRPRIPAAARRSASPGANRDTSSAQMTEKNMPRLSTSPVSMTGTTWARNGAKSSSAARAMVHGTRLASVGVYRMPRRPPAKPVALTASSNGSPVRGWVVSIRRGFASSSSRTAAKVCGRSGKASWQPRSAAQSANSRSSARWASAFTFDGSRMESGASPSSTAVRTRSGWRRM